MLWVDGIEYNVDVIKVKRKADPLDKYAKRTDDGVLHRELAGVYFNYSLQLGPNTDPESYDALWETLSAAEEFHTVKVPYGSSGIYTFEAYFSNVSDELLCKRGNHNVWNGLTVNFTAQKPART